MKWFNMIKNGEKGVVEIFDEIGGWGISARQFSDELKMLGDCKELEIQINSPGGSIIEGIAIYQMLLNSPVKKEVKIMGIAASMASVIAMAGDKIIMGDNTFMMIHNPWTMAMGDAEQLRKDAELLDKMKSQLVKAYQKKSGKPDDEISKMMDAETWLTAEEAKEKGFCDEIFAGLAVAAKVDAKTLSKEKIPEKARCWMKEEIKSEVKDVPEIAGKDASGSVVEPIVEKPAEPTPEAKIEQPAAPEVNIEAEIGKVKADLLADFTAKINAEKAIIAEKESKIEALNKALNDKQSKLDKAYADVTELNAKLDKLISGGVNFEPDIEDWSQAMSKCGGDYVKARKLYPALFSKFMEKHVNK